MFETNGRRPIGEMSIESQLLYKRLSKMKVGNVITYDELTEEIGRDVRSCIWALATARRQVLKTDSIVVDCVPGKGVKRLDDSAIVGTLVDGVKRISRASHRSARKASGIRNYDELPPDIKTQHNAALAALGAVRQLSKPSSVKKIEEKSEAANGRLQLEDTLKLFS